MSNKIILKRSAVASKVPLATDLDYGELAINYADGILYYKNAANGIGYLGSVGYTGSRGSVGYAGSQGGIGYTGSATVPFTQSTTPTNSKNGDLWWESDTGKMFIYYDDGTSAQWVQVNPDLLVEGPVGTYTLTGSLVTTSNLTVQGTLYETSDRNLKDNVNTINSALDILNQLRGVEFDWKKNGKHSYGVIAQELEKILPFLVQEDPTGIKTVNYSALIGLLIQSVKELAEMQRPKPPKKSLWAKIKENISGY